MKSSPKEHPIIDTLTAEITAANEMFRLLKRNPEKYIKRALGLLTVGLLYLYSERKISNVGTLSRVTYTFFRYIDDLLDGDLEVEGNPLAVVYRIKSDIHHNRPQQHPIAKIANHSLKSLNKLAHNDENPNELFTQAIDAMVYDYTRRENRTALTASELDSYYYNTFSHALNIMLIGFRSNLRVTRDNTLSNLAYCQGHIYSIRDLEDDWEAGIINIPIEILKQANLSSHSTYKAIIESPIIQRWMKNETATYKKKVIALQNELKNSGEKFTYQAINFSLFKHMLKTLD